MDPADAPHLRLLIFSSQIWASSQQQHGLHWNVHVDFGSLACMSEWIMHECNAKSIQTIFVTLLLKQQGPLESSLTLNPHRIWILIIPPDPITTETDIRILIAHCRKFSGSRLLQDAMYEPCTQSSHCWVLNYLQLLMLNYRRYAK